MNKQIEEMAKIIAQSVDEETLCDGLAGDSSMACLGCDYSEKEYCKHHLESAVGLYNKSYRKSTDVAREIFAELETVLCYKVHPVVDRDGFIHTIRTNDMHIRLEDFHTIKKKYESEAKE